MKRAICNSCRKEADLDPYGNTPQDWFTLRQQWADEQHLCSHACLVAAVTARLPQVSPSTEGADARVN